MPVSRSPIDESSYSDSGSFDPEQMLNPASSQQYAPSESDSWHPSASEQAYQPETAYQAEPTYEAPAPAADVVPESPQVAAATAAEPSATSRLGNVIANLFESLTSLKVVKFFGIVLFLFAAYSFVVCCSYFFTLDTDQSAVLNDEFNLDLYENAGRKFGAQLAHLLIYNWFGLGAFILIYYAGVCGLRLIGMFRPDFWSLTLRCLLSTVALSVVMGFATYSVASPVYWGGMHGRILNEQLIAYSGWWGAIAVTCAMIGMVVLLYLSELKRVISVVAGGWHKYSERRIERKARREELRAEARAKAEAEAAARAQAEAEAAARAQTQAAELAKAKAEAEAKVQAETKTEAETEAETVIEPVAPTYTPECEVPASDVTTDLSDRSERQPAGSEPLPALFPSGAGSLADQEEIDTSADTTADDDYPDDNYIDESPTEASENDEEYDDGPIGSLFPSQPEVAPESSAGASIPSVSEPVTAAVDPRDQPPYDPRRDLSHYKFPPLSLLSEFTERESVDAQEMDENKARITKTLADYGISILSIRATVGPTVTLYEIIPAEGVRISKIKNLEDDIALSLAALGIRIIAPIPGRGTIGIEVPNKDPQIVSMKSLLASENYQKSSMDLPMAIGKTVSNEVFMADLCKMPHLLVAGATGMGKSVGLNAIIASLLYKKHPTELKFVLIDPKMVEFSLYAKLEKHYLAKLPDEEDAIITNPSKVVSTLNSLCVEMDNRYALLRDAGMRTIKEYNERFCSHALNPEKGHRYLPYIVVVVDEFADLIMTAGKEVEQPIARIAQKARAVGMHMILATQRPSTNVITGVIKANFPGRIAFRVFQMVDSRTIIDRPGANQLIGRGDMLFSNNGKIDRVQCAFIDTPEVTAMCDFINSQTGFAGAYELPEYVPEASETAVGNTGGIVGDRDPLFNECAEFVVSAGAASTSMLQRRFSIGYNRAGKIMDQMEASGIVSPSLGIKGREVLVDNFTLESILGNK